MNTIRVVRIHKVWSADSIPAYLQARVSGELPGTISTVLTAAEIVAVTSVAKDTDDEHHGQKEK